MAQTSLKKNKIRNKKPVSGYKSKTGFKADPWKRLAQIGEIPYNNLGKLPHTEYQRPNYH